MGRIVIITALFPPEPVVSARTSSDIADALAARGHAVKVIAPFPSRPPGALYRRYSRRLTGATERLETGVEVVRCWSVFSRESTMLNRFVENISFGVTAGIALSFTRHVDAIYSNAWPLFTTGLIAAVARIRSLPLVITVQDTYPESLVLQGRMSAGSVLMRLLLRLDKWIANTATFVLLLGESSAKRYVTSRSLPSEKALVIPNWTNLELDSSPEVAVRFRESKGIPGSVFLLVYCGNIGAASGVERVVSAFGAFPPGADVGLLVAGEGSRLRDCETLARELPPGRVWFHHPFPDTDASAVLGCADVCVLPTSGQQSAASVPSKLIAYMLAGKPVIAAALDHSDTAAVMHASGCGWLVTPDSGEEFMRALCMVRRLPREELQARGEAGRAYASRYFTTAAGAPKVADAVEIAAKPR